MFSSVCRRLTYANVMVTFALVFAMSGGAYAASKYLVSSTKQISPKVLRALKGKAGPAGKAGAPGTQGPAGPAGAKGENGVAGTNGANGKDGVSVTSSVESKGANCKEGGSKFVAASGTTYACNGENGQTGFTTTLPSGATEQGNWGVISSVSGGAIEGIRSDSVSFNIPLKEAPTPHVVPAPTKEEEEKHEFPQPPAGCAGNYEKPRAEKGNLCLFARERLNVANFKVCSLGDASPPLGCELEGGASPESADPSGFVMAVTAEAGGLVTMDGTWAATAK
jgi:hypothetical protein